MFENGLYLVHRLHHDGIRTFGKVRDTDHARRVIARIQAEAEKDGHPTGISWQLVEGSMVDAMTASARI